MVELLLWKAFSQLLSRCDGQHVHPSIFGTYQIFNVQDFQILNFGFEYLKFEILNSSVLAILIIEEDLEKFWDIYQRFQYDTNVRQVKDISR